MPHDAWYYATGDQQVGPVSSVVLRQMLDAGQLTPDSPVWRDGWADWQTIGNVPEFATGASAIAAADPIPTANVLEYQPYQLPSPTFDPTSHYMKKFVRSRYTDTAYIAMVIAIMSLFFLRIIFAPVSLVMGISALVGLCKHGISQGRGMAIAAIAIGGLSTVLLVLAILAISFL
jgi:hypothetical protein